MQSASPEDLMTAAELAARLGVRPGTVLHWHRQGRIPARKLSPKVLRFNLAHVLSSLHPEAAPTETRRAEGGGL